MLVYKTVLAERQISSLRNRDLLSFNHFTVDLSQRGCAALGYRLTGPHPLKALCVKHLVGRLRVIIAFLDSTAAIVLLVGPHDRDRPEIDVYTLLYELLGVRPPDDERRTKPPCCDGGTGLPEPLGDLIEEL